MSRITMVFGLLLCGLTIAVLAIRQEIKSPTLFIPMGFGLPLIVLGIIAEFRPAIRKHVMHAAVLIGLIGALVSLGRGLPKLIQYVRGVPADSGKPLDVLALTMVLAMATLCTIYVILCVQSFIAARRARQLEFKS